MATKLKHKKKGIILHPNLLWKEGIFDGNKDTTIIFRTTNSFKQWLCNLPGFKTSELIMKAILYYVKNQYPKDFEIIQRQIELKAQENLTDNKIRFRRRLRSLTKEIRSGDFLDYKEEKLFGNPANMTKDKVGVIKDSFRIQRIIANKSLVGDLKKEIDLFKELLGDKTLEELDQYEHIKFCSCGRTISRDEMACPDCTKKIREGNIEAMKKRLAEIPESIKDLIMQQEIYPKTLKEMIAELQELESKLPKTFDKNEKKILMRQISDLRRRTEDLPKYIDKIPGKIEKLREEQSMIKRTVDDKM